MNVPHQVLDAARTTCHITWGTYGTRLHGSARPTVDKQHNQRGARECIARSILKFPPVILSADQRAFAESSLPEICMRGGWSYRVCAAGPDHVHLLCDIPPAIHGEKVRRLAKRWLGQALSEQWPMVKGATWWAEEGSNIAIHGAAYLNNAFKYILRQRATPFDDAAHAGAGDGPARSIAASASRAVSDPGASTMHYAFHINVFARPARAVACAPLELRGARITPLRDADAQPITFDAFFDVTFEDALAALVQLPRLDAEPDGFFVIAGGQGPTHWRVSGHLFDFDGRLHRVELHGDCPADAFDAILKCFGATPLAFELVNEGVALDAADFRAWASRGVPAP